MFQGGKWEVTSGMRMPQGVNVTMSYQVIHDRNPTRDTDFYGGPAGGLNSATERYREISGGGGGFDAFDKTNTGSFGFGTRLIDSGNLDAKLTESSFIEEIKTANLDMTNEDYNKDRHANLAVPSAPSTEQSDRAG